MRAIFSGLLASVLTVSAFAAEVPTQEGIVYGVADGQPLTCLSCLDLLN